MGILDTIKQLLEDPAQLDLEQLMEHLPDKLSDVFDQPFMKKYTQFENINNFLNEGEFNVAKMSDFKHVSQDGLNNFVNHKTTFDSWPEMLSCAATAFMAKSER